MWALRQALSRYRDRNRVGVSWQLTREETSPTISTANVRTTFLHVTGVTKCPAFAWPTLPTHAPHKGKCPKPHTLLGQLGPHTAKTWGILAFSAIPRGQTDSTVLCLGANITGDTTFERGQGGQNEVGLTFCYFFSVGLQARWAGLVGSCPRMCLPKHDLPASAPQVGCNNLVL